MVVAALEIWDPRSQRRDGVIANSAALLRVDLGEVCVAIDELPESCVDSSSDTLTLSGFAPGTHLVRVRGEGTRLIDCVQEASDEEAVAVVVDAPPPFEERPPQSLCVITNSLEAHSQNVVFATLSEGLDKKRWSPKWFVPALETSQISLRLSAASVPVQAMPVNIDWRDLRKRRQSNDTRTLGMNALGDCDLHLYANTYDDPFVAAMVEVAAVLAPGSVRVMELPNLSPPPGSAVDAFVAPSRFAATHPSLGAFEAVPRAIIYPAALDPADFDVEARPTRDFVVAYLGRLAPERSPGLFVRIVALLRRDPRFRQEPALPGETGDGRRAIVAIMAGDGPLRPELEKLSMQLGARVRFVGHVDNVPQWLAQADVLVHPRAYGETFGVANAEATALGVPVVAYARSGARESAPAATLLTTLEPADYAQTVADVLLDPDAKHKAQDARRSALDAFGRRRFLDAYDAFFSSLLEPKSVRVGASPGTGYAAPLVVKALKRIWPSAQVTLASSPSDNLDIGLIGCLDGGCADKWTDDCAAVASRARATARERGARATILVCGEPWDTPTDDAVLLVTTTPRAPNAVYLPVAATAVAELGLSREALEYALRQRGDPSKRGIAYLYYRCRLHRERFADALVARGLALAPLGACAGTRNQTNLADYVQRRFASNWHSDALELYRPYRFAVAFEQSDAPGYVTEKVLLAFLAGAIPIFWGNESAVTAIFNPAAFVNCRAFASLDDCAAEVHRLDTNQSALQAMLSASPLRSSGGLDLLSSASLPADLASRLSPLVHRSVR